MLHPTDEQSLAQAETRIQVDGLQVLACFSFHERALLQKFMQERNSEDVVIYDRYNRAVPITQDYVPDADDFPLKACIKASSSQGVGAVETAEEYRSRNADVEDPPLASNRNALADMAEPSWRVPFVQFCRSTVEKPARLQIAFTLAVTAVISCSVFLSCATMFLPLEYFTQSIRSHALTSCSSARRLQTHLLDEIALGDVSEVASATLLDSVYEKIKGNIIIPADQAVESVLGHMIMRRKFHSDSSFNSAEGRREVSIRAWIEMSSQCGGGQSCALSGVYAASDSGAFAGCSVQSSADPSLPSGLLWDAPIGGSPLTSRKIDFTTGLREGATEIQGSVKLPEEAFHAQSKYKQDAQVKRAWSRISTSEEDGASMFWTAPVAYCKQYSCMEGIVAAEVSFGAEVNKMLEEELNAAMLFASGHSVLPRNASSILLINQVSNNFPEQEGLQISEAPLDELHKEGLAGVASRAILQQFGSWKNTSLLEAEPRRLMNFSWAAVSSGAQDVRCAPLQDRGGMPSDCYLVSSRSIEMDARSRWLLVVVLHSDIFTGSTVDVENELDQKVTSFEQSSMESLEEGRANGLYVGIVMTLLSILTSLFVGRMVSGPLRHLTDLMDKLGDLDYEPAEALANQPERRSCIQDVAELQVAFGRLARGIGMFSRFVPQTVVRNIVSQGDAIATRLKLDRRVVTVMCTDIAGFTSIGELLVLRDLYFILTRYFSVMMSVVELYQGVVSEIQGDGLIVLWNAPDLVEDHATAACASALTQQQALFHINEELRVLELTPLSIRIGIHTGSSLLGNIGSMTKMKYGCLGDTKQLAMRLEEYCKQYEVDIICSSDTRDSIPSGKFLMRWLGDVPVRSDDGEMIGVHHVICRDHLEEESLLSPAAASSCRSHRDDAMDSFSVRSHSYPSLWSESPSHASPGNAVQRLPSIRFQEENPRRRIAMKRWLRYLQENRDLANLDGEDAGRTSEESAHQLAEMLVNRRTKQRAVVTHEQQQKQERHEGLYKSALKEFYRRNYAECEHLAMTVLSEKEDHTDAKRLIEAAGQMRRCLELGKRTLTTL